MAMDQSRAINALAPFVALANSATSPRAAADLVTQATSAPNTYIFAELLQQRNIQALKSSEKHQGFHRLLQIFAWGTWQDYQQQSSDLPPLSPAQVTKLRLLSLLTVAPQRMNGAEGSALSYSSIMKSLGITTPLELEQLITTAIYADLLTATLNPALQIVAVTCVAPLRDVAPGGVADMLVEISEWNTRCSSVLAYLQSEIVAIRERAKKEATRAAQARKQATAVIEAADKMTGGGSNSKAGNNGRSGKRETVDDDDYDDSMDIDSGSSNILGGQGKKRNPGGASSGLFSRVSGKIGR